MKKIMMYEYTGDFAENKDIARNIRIDTIIPSLEKEDKIIIDFKKVESATQSFIHALLSDIIQTKGAESLNNIYFKNCNEIIKKIIEIVTDYMQDSA